MAHAEVLTGTDDVSAAFTTAYDAAGKALAGWPTGRADRYEAILD